MSKLYGLLTSDSRVNPATSGGHREINATLRYGSASYSIKAIQVSVIYDPDDKSFTLHLDIPGQRYRTFDLAGGVATSDEANDHWAGYHGPNADDGSVVQHP